jgi:hypothetical protein
VLYGGVDSRAEDLVVEVQLSHHILVQFESRTRKRTLVRCTISTADSTKQVQRMCFMGRELSFSTSVASLHNYNLSTLEKVSLQITQGCLK